MSSNTNRFTEKSQEALIASQALAERNGNSQIEPEHLPLALLDALLGDAQTWQPAALLALADSWHQTSLAERLPTIRTPTLVVGAEHEPWLTAELLHRHVITPIPGARFVNVPNSSQYMHIEQAAFTAGLIIGFLAAD